MPWVKRNATTWDLYLNNDKAGYVVLTKYKDGHSSYSGIAFNGRSRAVSKAVVGTKLTPVKAAVERMARAQRK